MKKLITVMLIASCVLSCNNDPKKMSKEDLKAFYKDEAQAYLDRRATEFDAGVLRIEIESLDSISKTSRMEVMKFTLVPTLKKINENNEKIYEYELDKLVEGGAYSVMIDNLEAENERLNAENQEKLTEFEKLPKIKNQTTVFFKVTLYNSDGTKNKHTVIPVVFDEDNEIDDLIMESLYK